MKKKIKNYPLLLKRHAIPRIPRSQCILYIRN